MSLINFSIKSAYITKVIYEDDLLYEDNCLKKRAIKE